MAISVNWITGVISIPKADTQLVQSSPTEVRRLDLNAFRLILRDLEDDPDGRPWPRTHDHNEDVTVGGVTLADVLTIKNPYTITFEDGQYAVELVGANSNVGDKVNVNQVSIRSANSAGLTNSEAINDQSFLNGFVYIDTVSGVEGTIFPRGTSSDPVNNITDAYQIASSRKLRGFSINGEITLDRNYDRWKFIGSISRNDAIINLNGFNVLNCKFIGTELKGTGSGVISADNCYFTNVTGISGVINNTGINSIFAPGNNTVLELIDCWSNIIGGGAIVDLGDVQDVDTVIIGWRRGMTIQNIDVATQIVSVNLQGGVITLDATNTDGEISFEGYGTVIDNSNGTLVDTSVFISNKTLSNLKFIDLLKAKEA